MAAVDARTVAVQAWSMQEVESALAVASNAQRAALADWLSFVDWYAAAATVEQARHTAGLVAAARDAAAHIGAAYMSELLSMLGSARVSDTRLPLPPARLGADLTTVYMRPAAAYRRTFALTGNVEEAKAASDKRLSAMISEDVMIARRDGEQLVMHRADVRGWRRILHPELAKSESSCGLCVAAAHQKYRTSNLRAVHAGCNCSVAPLVGDFDPRVVNDADLAAAYAAAGDSNKGADLKRTRFRINEHGELGPVLTDAAHKFQGPGDPDNVDAIARARRRLVAAEDVLTQLEGSDNPAALHYQRKFVTHLRSTADQAA